MRWKLAAKIRLISESKYLQLAIRAKTLSTKFFVPSCMDFLVSNCCFHTQELVCAPWCSGVEYKTNTFWSLMIFIMYNHYTHFSVSVLITSGHALQIKTKQNKKTTQNIQSACELVCAQEMETNVNKTHILFSDIMKQHLPRKLHQIYHTFLRTIKHLSVKNIPLSCNFF